MDGLGISDRYAKILKGKNILLYEPDEFLFLLITDMLRFYEVVVWNEHRKRLDCVDMYVIAVSKKLECPTLKNIRNLERMLPMYPKPAIALSDSNDQLARNIILEMGFNAILFKPFGANQLLNSLCQHLQK